MHRITGGYGADIVIDGVGGEVLSEALGALALGGSLTTLGYAKAYRAVMPTPGIGSASARLKIGAVIRY